MLKKILLLSLIALVAIPAIGVAIDFGRPPEVQDQPNAESANFVLNFLGSILDILWIIFIAFAIIMFIVAGFQFLAAQGEPEGLGKAKKAVLWGVIGVVVAIAAFTLPFFIKNTITPQQQGNSNCDNGAWQASGYTSEDDCYAAYGGR